MDSALPSIRYEFDERPDTGQAMELAPGIKWLRLPLPFLLQHINVWLLRDGPGWTLVDTGLHTQTTREVWAHLLEQALEGLPLTRVLVTHLHPDHVGCAGWLCREHDVQLWMTREEYLLCRVLVADTGQSAPPEGVRFYRGAGFADDAMTRYRETFGMFGRVVSPLPQAYQRLFEGQEITIGEDSWRVIVGRGHSPEHACLYCESRNILISGDQILPTISSNVSVYPTEPAANPLALWFESLNRLKQELDEDVLVLPAHGKPFRGAHIRLDELIAEHEGGLHKLRRLCREPQRAVDVFPALFKSRINEKNLIMATGEAIAHLNYLEQAGEMNCMQGRDGIKRYRMRS